LEGVIDFYGLLMLTVAIECDDVEMAFRSVFCEFGLAAVGFRIGLFCRLVLARRFNQEYHAGVGDAVVYFPNVV
jgi:hypothetical protein